MYTLDYWIIARQMFRYLDQLYIQQSHQKYERFAKCFQAKWICNQISLIEWLQIFKKTVCNELLFVLHMTLTLIITHCCFLLCIHHDIFFILRKAPWSKIENEVRYTSTLYGQRNPIKSDIFTTSYFYGILYTK